MDFSFQEETTKPKRELEKPLPGSALFASDDILSFEMAVQTEPQWFKITMNRDYGALSLANADTLISEEENREGSIGQVVTAVLAEDLDALEKRIEAAAKEGCEEEVLQFGAFKKAVRYGRWKSIVYLGLKIYKAAEIEWIKKGRPTDFPQRPDYFDEELWEFLEGLVHAMEAADYDMPKYWKEIAATWVRIETEGY